MLLCVFCWEQTTPGAILSVEFTSERHSVCGGKYTVSGVRWTVFYGLKKIGSR